MTSTTLYISFPFSFFWGVKGLKEIFSRLKRLTYYSTMEMILTILSEGMKVVS